MKLRKIFLTLTVILSAFLLTGCLEDIFSSEKEVVLSNKEKFELLQEFDFDLSKSYKNTTSFDVDGMIDESLMKINSNITFHLETDDEDNTIALANVNINAKILEDEINGGGSLLIYEDKAYLNIDASFKESGSTINIKSKEFLVYTSYLDEILGSLGSLDDFDGIKEEFRALKYDDLEKEVKETLDFFLNLIKFYKKGDRYSIAFKLTLADIEELIKDEEQTTSSILESFKHFSKVELTVIVKNNEIIEFSINVNLSIASPDESEKYEIKLTSKTEYNPTKITVPSTEELNEYEEVEMFSILKNIFGIVPKDPELNP